MTWTKKEERGSDHSEYEKGSSPIGNGIELEGLEKYVLRMENDNKSGKLILVIEDSVNRYNLVFENPRLEKSIENQYALYALGEKGMLAKGPDLVAELQRNTNKLKIFEFKGRKTIFHEDVLLEKDEIIRFEQYLLANFG